MQRLAVDLQREQGVGIAGLDGDLVVWTVADAGKVKRIRREPAVTVATCDMRGQHAGAAHPGRASILDPPGSAAVRRAIGRKYGVPGRLTLWVSRIRRGRDGTVGIRIALGSATT